MNKKVVCLMAVVGMIAMSMVSCGSKDGSKNGYPKDNLNDTAKVAFMIKKCSPDSVARYICCTFLGWNKGCTLDSLSVAVPYAYSKYKGNDLMTFSNEFEQFSNNLPLAQRMTLMSNAAMYDPINLGYEMGLSYAGEIQSEQKTLADIDKEMNALKEACGQDSVTYLRVLRGLSEAISLPEYENLPEDVKAKYGKVPVIPKPVISDDDVVDMK